MRLRNLVRKLKLGLAGLVGGFAFACSGPNPGEMPPMAPRPEPVQPMPNGTNPKAPVPGAPDPIAVPDGGAPVTQMPSPKIESSHEPMQTPGDAGVSDAVEMPKQVPDAMPSDANKRPESASFACC